MGRVSRWRFAAASLFLALVVGLPGWSAAPQIAFALDTAAEGRASRIYVANLDGSGLRPISPGNGRDRAPAFSPDGTAIAYQTTNELGLESLLVQSLDGSPGRVVATGGFPQWSRDGKRILFSRRQLNDYSLYVARADGSDRDASLKPLAHGLIGRWSPDESRLAAVAPVIAEGQDRWQLQVMQTGAKEPKLRLTLPETYGQVISLEWSPDGNSLVFSVAHGAQNELFVLDLKSPEPRKVPRPEEAMSAYPNPGYGAWSPDGKQIVFRSSGDASGAASRLCVMDADGSHPHVLWEPDNRMLRMHSVTWYRPLPVVVQNPPKVAVPPVQPEVVKPPAPTPMPPMPAPMPMPALGPPVKVSSQKLFAVEPERSPVSVKLATPGANDWVVTVPLLPQNGWTPRRQGVGVTVELEDGSLYRGTVIYSGQPWVTLQGRPKGGKVRLIDGKQMGLDVAGFGKGFRLMVRREGNTLRIGVNDQDILSRAIMTSPVKSLYLTLENFDPGPAKFPVGNVYYRKAE